MNPAPPPVFSHLFFESPWAVMVTLAAAGLVVGVVGRRRGQGKLAAALWLGPAAAVAVWVLARVVTTDREAAIGQTRALVAATAPWDVRAVIERFDVRAQLVGPTGGAWLNLGQLRDELLHAAPQYPIVKQTIDRLDAQVIDGATAVTEVALRTTFDPDLGVALPVPSRWRVTWQKDNAGTYRVLQLQWLELMNRPAQEGVWP